LPHKADPSFFEKKRDWSKRKDLILAYYLKPYIAKVATLRRPILVVDGFAGPGEYGDGNPGSPLIICSEVQQALSHVKVPVSVLCVEEDDDLYSRLTALLERFPFAKAQHGSFLDALSEVEQLARTHTVFLYVDPYAIAGLQWEAMDRIFRHVQDSSSSIEVLLNFSAANLVRRGLAALKLQSSASDDDLDASDDAGTTEAPSIKRLNEVVGGEWWQVILRDNGDFALKVELIAKEFRQKLSTRFREVRDHPVKAKWTDRVPKYSLVFGSRSSDALILMNEAMIKSRDILAESAKPKAQTLFETRPVELVPDPSRLPDLVLENAREPKTRHEVIVGVVRQAFCTFSESEIRRAVEALLKNGRLKSSTGKPRINDTVIVWKT
jgi:three-Cys-motif partner protein